MQVKGMEMPENARKWLWSLWIAGMILLCFLFPVGTQAASYWTVTQRGTASGSQGMFYTITDSRGRLIIIDGGWESDANRVLSVIRRHQNHVYAWFITHPHSDHVGAFNRIMSTRNRIRVDHIYVTAVNGARYRATADASWDEYGAYRKFLRVTKGRRLSYLRENNTRTVLGLRVKVLHGWDSSVDRLKGGLCNNGSLMLKFSGKKQSMLFCADTQKDVEKTIIRRHRRELRCDYVQCAHHGNWGLTKEFYRCVGAKVAFFDAPERSLSNKNSSYNAGVLIPWFRSRHTRIFRMSKAPNSVTLR